MNHGADLVRSLGEHIHRILLVLIALVRSLGRETGELGQAIDAAESLDVFVENLIRGRSFAEGLAQFVGFFQRGRPVQIRQIRSDVRDAPRRDGRSNK